MAAARGGGCADGVLPAAAVPQRRLTRYDRTRTTATRLRLTTGGSPPSWRAVRRSCGFGFAWRTWWWAGLSRRLEGRRSVGCRWSSAYCAHLAQGGTPPPRSASRTRTRSNPPPPHVQLCGHGPPRQAAPRPLPRELLGRARLLRRCAEFARELRSPVPYGLTRQALCARVVSLREGGGGEMVGGQAERVVQAGSPGHRLTNRTTQTKETKR